MKVLDMGAGGGYSTELMARAVGPSGVVYGQNAPDFGARGSLLPKPFGVTCAPITHEPPVNGVEDFGLVRQEKPDAPELARCWRQQEPAHKLINLKNIPTLQMSAQFGLAEVSKKPAVAFHRNLIFEDLQRLP
jgi:predicted methyltransferase